METVRHSFRNKIRNLSIKKTIILYIFITLMISYVISFFVIQTVERKQRQIWTKYMGEEYFRAIESYGVGDAPEEVMENDVPDVRPYPEEMSDVDRVLSEMCDFWITYSALVFSAMGTVLAVFLFYRNKLQVPLARLTEASNQIGHRNLDFVLSYSNEDEMGTLCKNFEMMRRQLVENNRQMWKMVEQEKALRASVAHDIRAPLTVLKGYQEMLLEFSPEQETDREQVSEMLREGMAQIQRMETFLDRMRQLSALEERSIERREVSIFSLAERCRKNMEMLADGSEKKCDFILQAKQETVCVDEEIVMEVFDNLMMNGLRYAKRGVTVLFAADGDELRVVVRDDGQGFAEDVKVLTQIYYHANPQDDLTHFGMGLYLCRLYCEKHGGRLLLANRREGGGEAVAVFSE